MPINRLDPATPRSPYYESAFDPQSLAVIAEQYTECPCKLVCPRPSCAAQDSVEVLGYVGGANSAAPGQPTSQLDGSLDYLVLVFCHTCLSRGGIYFWGGGN